MLSTPENQHLWANQKPVPHVIDLCVVCDVVLIVGVREADADRRLQVQHVGNLLGNSETNPH